MKFDKRTIAIALVFAFFATIGLVLVSGYSEALFLVLVLWILIPVLLARLYEKIRGK